jgi:hypothetical protein
MPLSYALCIYCFETINHKFWLLTFNLLVQEVIQYCNDCKTHLAGINQSKANQSDNLLVPGLGAENATHSDFIMPFIT